MSTRGAGQDILARAWTRARVVSTRLERRSCLRWGVQRFFRRIGAPPRFDYGVGAYRGGSA